MRLSLFVCWKRARRICHTDGMIDDLLHKWLRVPYPLHVKTRRPTTHPRATVVFIHGIGNSGAARSEIVSALPDDIYYITIDLLGFGDSPRPSWAMYDAKTQARSVMVTLLKLRLTGRVIIVGHSLGSLVAVEIAKRYPLLVSSLILCSPPFYQPDAKNLLPSTDKLVKLIFKVAKKHPKQFVAVSVAAKKYGLVHQAFNLSTDNVDTYMNALEATVINQRSFDDALRLRLPITILHGTFDPVVMPRNLKKLAKVNTYVNLIHIIAGHDVRGRFVPAVIQAIDRHIAKR